MKKRIRATFSKEDHALHIEAPRGWHELEDGELRMVYDLLSRYGDEDVRFHIFRRICGLRMSRRKPEAGRFTFYVDAIANGRKRTIRIRMSAAEVESVLNQFDWIGEPGNVPVRVASIDGAAAIDAQLHGLKFASYLALENLYQGYIAAKNRKSLSAMMAILYPRDERWGEIDEATELNLLNWLIQVKNRFAAYFPNLFTGGGGGEVNMLEIMNNEIRALTQGDVTKEAQVLEIDCWRALTELDFKAKEAEEFRKEMNKSKRNGR